MGFHQHNAGWNYIKQKEPQIMITKSTERSQEQFQVIENSLENIREAIHLKMKSAALNMVYEFYNDENNEESEIMKC